ncbi:MAG: SDR family oxidoreductase [Actinobacteria bacterium]|nr:SDR family oxidoreductase [Actinomycetota bacterium]
MKDLKGKVVVITGAASGMGQAAAVAFANQGSRVVAIDINEEGLKKTVSLLDGKSAESMSMKVDLTSEESVKEMAETVIDKYGGADVLVNVAGVLMLGDFADSPLKQWKWVVDVNLFGQANTIHYLLPAMIERKSGHIVNVASAAGLFPITCLSAYTASKHASVGFSEVLSQELREHGILVTTVCPGGSNTPMGESMITHGFSQTEKLSLSNTSSLRKFLTSPEDLADLMVKSVLDEKPGIVAMRGTRILHFIHKYLPAMYRWMMKSVRAGINKNIR